MPPQVAFNIGERAGLEPPRRVALEVTVDDASEGHRRLSALFRLFGLRIPAEMHLGQHVFRALARGERVEIFDGAERHPALLRSDAILRNPRPLAAIAD